MDSVHAASGRDSRPATATTKSSPKPAASVNTLPLSPGLTPGPAGRPRHAVVKGSGRAPFPNAFPLATRAWSSGAAAIISRAVPRRDGAIARRRAAVTASAPAARSSPSTTSEEQRGSPGLRTLDSSPFRAHRAISRAAWATWWERRKRYSHLRQARLTHGHQRNRNRRETGPGENRSRPGLERARRGTRRVRRGAAAARIRRPARPHVQQLGQQGGAGLAGAALLRWGPRDGQRRAPAGLRNLPAARKEGRHRLGTAGSRRGSERFPSPRRCATRPSTRTATKTASSSSTASTSSITSSAPGPWRLAWGRTASSTVF